MKPLASGLDGTRQKRWSAKRVVVRVTEIFHKGMRPGLTGCYFAAVYYGNNP